MNMKYAFIQLVIFLVAGSSTTHTHTYLNQQWDGISCLTCPLVHQKEQSDRVQHEVVFFLETSEKQEHFEPLFYQVDKLK